MEKPLKIEKFLNKEKNSNQLKIDLAMPEIVVNDDFFLLGTDSDDHRHDDSEELKRIMQTMIFSDICNFIQFFFDKFFTDFI